MRVLYIDTNVFMDYYTNRMAGIVPLSYYAEMLFDAIISCKYSLVISDHVISELKRVLYKDVYPLFKAYDVLNKVTWVNAEMSDIREAERLSAAYNIPRSDAVHFVLAKKNGCILVTRDKHFDGLKGSIDVKKPEELI